MTIPRKVILCAAAASLLATACRPHQATAPRKDAASGRAATAAPSPTATPAPPLPILSAPHLAPGSDPSVLPGPILIADRNNNRLLVVDPQGRIRWEFPRPGDLAAGQSFLVPDDAFFTPDGRHIVATQEDDFAISTIDLAGHRVVYRYGVPGVHGMGPNLLWNPDDAMALANGSIVSADIKNCRLLLIGAGQHRPARVYGQSTNDCLHDPPARWGSPNGAFPMSDGNFLVTEINGNWVDQLNLASGKVGFTIHPPGTSYPSDTNEVRPGLYLTVDYTYPGQIETFDRQGRLVWRYRPRWPHALDHPSLALPLPNGDILCNDDRNHRVIVVDPRTDRVVWQYGVTGRPGSAPGLLANPDGVDLLPPFSLADRFSATLRTAGAPTPHPVG
ncbi:MAG: hypothetical protein ACREPA_04205 [Candidatus Dormibacteraceae bacterium]